MFQQHPANKTPRRSAAAAKSAALGESLKATPGAMLDDLDRQVVNLLALGSSRAVIATMVGISQTTVKKRIAEMEGRKDGKA